MELDFNKIRIIKEVREEIADLRNEHEALCAPIFDCSRIMELFNLFCDETGYLNRQFDRRAAQLRRMFIFIALYMFYPGVLAGGQLPHGIRLQFAAILGIKSVSTFSNDISTLLFQYQNYPSFKKEVDTIYVTLIDKMNS